MQSTRQQENSDMSFESGKKEWIVIIAMIVLLIGMAMDNAWAMLLMAGFAFLLIALISHRYIGKGALCVAVVSSIIATVIGYAASMR